MSPGTPEQYERRVCFFIRRLFNLLKEKKTFWRLLFQLVMQNEVREKLLNIFPSSGIFSEEKSNFPVQAFLNTIINTLTDYFVRKKKMRVLIMTLFVNFIFSPFC
jgi:hypothetical protein